MVSVAVLTVAGIFTYNWYKKKFLNQTVKETVNTETKGLYRINYDEVAVDEVNGELFVTNVSIIPDTAFLATRAISSDDPGLLVKISASSIHVTGVQTPRALLNKQIKGRALIISDAKVELLQLKRDTTTKKDDDSALNTNAIADKIYREVLKDIDLVSIDTLALDHVDFSYKDYKTNKTIIASKDLSLRLYKVVIDENAGVQKDRFLFAENIALIADSVKLADKKNQYQFIFSGISLNTANRKIELKSVDIQPRKGEQAFVQQFDVQKDRFDFSFDNVSLSGLDLRAMTTGQMIIDTLRISKSSFRIYRDQNLPRDKVIRVGTYPHQIMDDIPFGLQVKTAIFSNTFIEYKERNDKTDRAGEVQFVNSSAVIENITNISSVLKQHPLCTINFKASFLGISNLNVKLKMRLGDKQGRFTVDGEMGGFEAKKLNPLTEPMGRARVDRGMVEKVSFHMDGNNYKGSGTVNMLYKDLKIAALKLDDDNDFKKKGLASIVANAIVKNNNPQNGKTRTATVNYDRDTNKSFFNLIWKFIFTGVKEIVGMGGDEKKK